MGLANKNEMLHQLILMVPDIWQRVLPCTVNGPLFYNQGILARHFVEFYHMTSLLMPPFHLAFPVTDLSATLEFYRDTIGCQIGRTSQRWIDFDFFGHQITAHLVEQMPEVATNPVDDKDVPSSHFGAVLSWEQWHDLRDRLQIAGREFLIGPYIRFRGEPGEQATLFISDPSGNGLEFKSFRNPEMLFAT